MQLNLLCYVYAGENGENVDADQVPVVIPVEGKTSHIAI